MKALFLNESAIVKKFELELQEIRVFMTLMTLMDPDERSPFSVLDTFVKGNITLIVTHIIKW